MKYLDFTTLFDGDPAYIALLSTFQFDPTYFEKRLLRCPTLTRARRIAVFLDAREWFELLRQDTPARWLNRRYLVVPIYRAQGVFHPKLNLLISERGGQIQCGSNNLTRSGCSSNLELLNAVPFEVDGNYKEELRLAQEAFSFFTRAVEDADDEVARIARGWLDETATTFPWLAEPVERQQDRRFRLFHNYDGSIWSRIVESLENSPPRTLFILSPFHDADYKMLRRVLQRWPCCKIELFVQSGYTNLPITPLKRFRSSVALSEFGEKSRRLHAKLFAWESSAGISCLVGSANFTAAAFDGRNVEACLMLLEADELFAALFDKDLPKRRIDLDDFEPGSEQEPGEKTVELPCVRLDSAVLVGANQLRIVYSHHLQEKPSGLRVAIRTPGEPRPRTSIRVPNREAGKETIALPQNVLADSDGRLLAALIAELQDCRIESVPVWIVHEGHLTYEPGEGSSSTKQKVEETGEGLSEYLDEIGKRDGISSVIDYLRRLNIRFYDGAHGWHGNRKFRLRIHDPFHADTVPDWLMNTKDQSGNLEEAIYDFVDRHEKLRLRKHASRGNVNGMENFIDIFTAMIRLLYVYHQRGVVKREMLIGRICNFIEIATKRLDSEDGPSDGFLFAIYENLGEDSKLLQTVCYEMNFSAELRAALLIAQKARFVPNEPTRYGPVPERPKDCLRSWADAITNTLAEVSVREPSEDNVRKALEAYRMVSKEEVEKLLAEL